MRVVIEDITVAKVVLESGDEEETLYKINGYWYLVGSLEGFDNDVYKPLMPNTTLTKMLDEVLLYK